MPKIAVSDLAAVVYSSGKVFDGLSTGRLDTENFLRSGSLEGVTSRSDLALLEDLRDVAQFVIDQETGETTRPIDAAFVSEINARMTRSAALHPGVLRREDQHIGVNTRYGRHTPPALTVDAVQRLVLDAVGGPDPIEGALELFVRLAKAQPFGDGNKRTALFAANALLLAARVPYVLVVPVDDADPSVADTFNDLLARAYVHDEDAGVKDMLRDRGLSNLP